MSELVNEVTTRVYDTLIGGTEPEVIVHNATILSGSNIAGTPLLRGTVLGAIKSIAVAATPVRTGNGTIASLAVKKAAKIGTYVLKCKTAAANAGIFSVTDPDGIVLPDATVAVAYAGQQIAFTIGDGTTDFIVGDEFDVIVSYSGKFTTVNSANTNGSHIANCVLMEDIDSSAGDAVAPVYVSGCFNREALIFGGTDTAAWHEAELRNSDIYLTSIR